MEHQSTARIMEALFSPDTGTAPGVLAMWWAAMGSSRVWELRPVQPTSVSGSIVTIMIGSMVSMATSWLGAVSVPLMLLCVKNW